jgi:hypothetical protein
MEGVDIADHGGLLAHLLTGELGECGPRHIAIVGNPGGQDVGVEHCDEADQVAAGFG